MRTTVPRAKPWLPVRALAPALATVLLALPALARAEGPRWHPGIGDPGLLGWTAVVGYATAIGLCVRNGRRESRGAGSGAFWIGLSALLLVLGVNKQLDLQTWFAEVAKDLVRNAGWWDARRQLQIGFVLVLWMGGMTFTVALRRFVAESWHAYRLACMGTALLVLFVLLRATRFHLENWLTGADPDAAIADEVLELCALLCIAFGAQHWWRLHPEGGPSGRSLAKGEQ
jgi:hypothetical protein